MIDLIQNVSIIVLAVGICFNSRAIGHLSDALRNRGRR